MEVKQGWHPDPFGAHEMRWYSQGDPTQLVRDHGRETYDPPPEGATLPIEDATPDTNPEEPSEEPPNAELPQHVSEPAKPSRSDPLTPSELVWLEERAEASLEAAKVAASEATRLLSANPDLDGSALAGAVWWFLNTQAELLAAFRELTSSESGEKAASYRDEMLAVDLPQDWDEPREWLERTHRWRGKRR